VTQFEATREVWPVPIAPIYRWRMKRLAEFQANPALLVSARKYYRSHKAEFIAHWIDTFDPRQAGSGRPPSMPFVMFRRQYEFVEFLDSCVSGRTNGLVEKCRDMGATWVACAWSVATWLFEPGAAIGWGSRKQTLVDTLGDADSIFEKMRMIVYGLPREFWPVGFDPKRHMTFMKIINPETDASITGEAGDNIGRGGRKLIYFKDESAHYARPEMIEAALGDNTNTQIDISSVCGAGNVFYRRRMSGVDWSPGASLSKDRANVFVMDWRDHPAKDQSWYDRRRQTAENEGLLHLFAQEVDRDYFSALEGVIIPALWVNSSVDAHIKLGIQPTGRHTAALDVADGGGDSNAISIRKDVLITDVQEWGEVDTGKTAGRAIKLCTEYNCASLEYDSIGVGAGIKAETNRLRELGKLPKGLHISAWNAGAGVLQPKERLIPGDQESLRNEDYYENFKAQAWWQVRRRFEITHRALTETGYTYNPKDIISLSSKMRLLSKLKQELSQPTFTQSRNLLLMVDKKPDGTPSPNLADCVVMNIWPMPINKPQLIPVRIG